jgi:hypothetical protein
MTNKLPQESQRKVPLQEHEQGFPMLVHVSDRKKKD